MVKIIKILFFSLLLLIKLDNLSANNSILNYTNTFMPLYTQQGELRIAIRHFELNHVISALLVNPYTLETEIVPLSRLYYRDPHRDTPKSLSYASWANIKKTPYLRALNQYTEYSHSIENAGITHAEWKNPLSYFLTVDMCPTVKPFERRLFLRLAELSHLSGHAFPVAISISGLWILQHPQEWAWLLSLQRTNKLAITWVNHSFAHLYFNDLPLDQNFLLFQHTHLPDEIMSTERMLIEQGLLPSVFFRAPGLVTNRHVLSKLKDYGLIPLGANAWLAKHQQPESASIILIHGNGLEPLGVNLLMPYLTPNNLGVFLPLNRLLAP